MTTKPRAIKGWCSKCGERAGKANVLTWGDLSSGFQVILTVIPG
ncbi:MAG: hypothetical protein NTW32_06850 [Chloroflexi bacterium]|nr:hypothetical protein [Chloroflexota bacterium]